MADELCLFAIAGTGLLWYLALALRQLRTQRSHTPVLVWRSASASGWSDWVDLEGVSPSADYGTVLTEVRNLAERDG